VQAIIDRVKRAVTLQQGVFSEIGADPEATRQAILVALASSLIGGIFALFGGDITGWLLTGVLSVVGLFIGAGILFLISRLFKGQGEYINLFRGLGFASAPQVLGIIPVIGALVGGIWSIVLAIRAVKETQQVTDGAAIAIVLIPVAVLVVLGVIFGSILALSMLGGAAAN
jgi:hypothetical protein